MSRVLVDLGVVTAPGARGSAQPAIPGRSPRPLQQSICGGYSATGDEKISENF